MPAPLLKDLRNRIVQNYIFVSNHKKSSVVKYFKKEKIGKRTIYRLLRHYDEHGDVEVDPNYGKGVRKTSARKVNAVYRKFSKKPDITISRAARELKMPVSTVQRIKAEELHLKAYTKKVAPKYVRDQQTRAKRNCRKIYRKIIPSGAGLKLVIDDESYFPLDPNEYGCRKYYHAMSPRSVPVEFRIKPKEKFPKKVMVWHAMDEDGNVSKPVFFEGNVNGQVYSKECVRKVLVPFIKTHHKIEEVLFWPDMATSHYIPDVTSYLMAEKVEFVQKHSNAPNVPQARGIERFWAIMKSRYSKLPKAPNTLTQFKRSYNRLLKKVTKSDVQDVMKTARGNLRKIGLQGVYSTM